MDNKYFVRMIKRDGIKEVPLDGQIFDIMFKCKNGDIRIKIKDDMLKVMSDFKLIVHPESANCITLESTNQFQVNIDN
jgi:uncharacterized protein YxjI